MYTYNTNKKQNPSRGLQARTPGSDETEKREKREGKKSDSKTVVLYYA
jgi:hypothetical protein